MNEKKGKLTLILVIFGIVAIVTGIWVLSERLSDEALAVLAGSVCGVAAAIPTSVLIMAVQRHNNKPQQPQQPQQPQTPIVMMPPQMIQPQVLPPGQGYNQAEITQSSRRRRFEILGDDSSG